MKHFPPAHSWIRFFQGEKVEGEMKIMISEKSKGKWRKPREGLFILTNFRLLFVPLKMASSVISLIRSSTSSSSSSLFLDASEGKEGVYCSFCPTVRFFQGGAEEIGDEDLADLVDLGALTEQNQGPPHWVKTKLKDKIERKDNLSHLAPLQWLESAGKGGEKRTKKESGFKPKPKKGNHVGVVEWTNKGVCCNSRIVSIPLGMIYEIDILYEQNSKGQDDRGATWPRSLPETLMYRTTSVIQLELRSFRSLRFLFLSPSQRWSSISANSSPPQKEAKEGEETQNTKGTMKESETTEAETKEPPPEDEMIGEEACELNEMILSPSDELLAARQQLNERTQGKWGGGWWSATVAVATNALALAGGADFQEVVTPVREEKEEEEESPRKVAVKEEITDEEGWNNRLRNMTREECSKNTYESCLQKLFQSVFFKKIGFSALACSPSLSSPSTFEWVPFDIRQEFLRLGFYESGYWRISDLNHKFQVSESYPKRVITPASITDPSLQKVARYRSKRRFPAITWRNTKNGVIMARCSQPLPGLLRNRSTEDEVLVQTMIASVKAERKEREKEKEEAQIEEKEKEKDQEKEEIDEEDVDGLMVVNLKEQSSEMSWCHVSGETEDEEEEEEEEEDEEDEGDEEANKNGDLEIYDCRSQIAAVANFAQGAGTENPGNYEGCSLSFLAIQNIHAVRSSLGMLRTLCNEQNVSEWKWCSSLEGTQWLCHIQTILSGSLSVAKTLHYGRSVLIHCSDGWDRTAQVSALAQIFLDPFFRTMEGFEVLVEKEWISFGHKFHDRLAPGREKYFAHNEACPVFQQWIECVWQVQRQFPCAFEFNEKFLLFLVDSLLSGTFGNFSFNCEKEREAAGLYTKTNSIWNFTRERCDLFKNPQFLPQNDEPLFPAAEMWRLRLWGDSFFRHYCWSETQDSHT